MFHVLAKQILGCQIGGQGFGQLWQAQWTKMAKWNTNEMRAYNLFTTSTRRPAEYHHSRVKLY